MDNQVELEEIARILGHCEHFSTCEKCLSATGTTSCWDRDMAKLLIKKGYGKIDKSISSVEGSEQVAEMSADEIKKVLDDNNLTKEKVKSLILENKDVCREQTINGYYVRTIVCQRVPDGEIVLKVLAVYDHKGDTNVVQYNVDVENLFGTLLHSVAFEPNNPEDKDFDDIVKQFMKYYDMGKR